MNLIPYEEFTINVNILKKLNEYYVSKKINEYYTQNGQLPDSGTVETFTIPEKLMDRYKKHFYAEYYRKEAEFEKEYGPSEMIETSFDFSTADDNGPTLLGAKSPMLLGASTSGGDAEYPYEYWNIVVFDKTLNKCCGIGSFTTLENVSISLNSLKTYAFAIYHRKSKYIYKQTREYIPLDNQFHNMSTIRDDGYISSYSIKNIIPELGYSMPGEEYNTQSEDKEYIGTIDNYTPYKGGIVRGSVYTLSPQKLIMVSGLTSGLTLSLSLGKRIIFNCDHYGQLTTNGDPSRLTILSDTSFSYLMSKEELINKLRQSRLIYEFGNTITVCHPEDANYEIGVGSGLSCQKENGEVAVGVTITGGYTICRNGISELGINIPPQGEDIDTGFEFNTIDD